MKFGVRLPANGPFAGEEAIVEIAKTAESLGFYSIWLPDYIAWRKEFASDYISAGTKELYEGEPSQDFYECITTLVLLSRETSLVKIGPSVLILPLRDPVLVARQLAVVDVLSRGRLILGVGVGDEKQFQALQIPLKGRGPRTTESIKLIEKLWTEPDADFLGRFYRISSIGCYPQPYQKPRPKIWIGGNSPNAIKRVAEVGDGWLPFYLTPDEFESAIARLKAEAAKFSRDPTELTVGSLNFICIGSSREEARMIAAKTLTGKFGSIENGATRNLIGSPEDITRTLKTYQDVGVQHIELKFICRSMDVMKDAMRIFSSEIAPQLSD